MLFLELLKILIVQEPLLKVVQMFHLALLKVNQLISLIQRFLFACRLVQLLLLYVSLLRKYYFLLKYLSQSVFINLIWIQDHLRERTFLQINKIFAFCQDQMPHAFTVDFIWFDFKLCKRGDQKLGSLFVKGYFFNLQFAFHSRLIEKVCFLEFVDDAIFILFNLGLLIGTAKLEWSNRKM